MSQIFDYVVIGGGCIGTSVAYHLTMKGAKSVALVEREKFLGQCSTGKCAGGVRAQFSTEVNARLSLYSLSAFERFEQETGQPLQFFQWGYLFLLTNPAQVESFRGYREMWKRLGMTVEWLSPNDIAGRFPYVDTEGVLAGTFHQRDGFVDPNDITQGYASAARRMGAVQFTDCEVTAVGLDGSGNRVVSLSTTQGEIRVGKACVLAAGAWSKPLGRMLGLDIPIDPYRRQILVTKPFDAIATPFPMTVDMGTGLYFHPESGGVLIGLADNTETPSYNEALNEAFSEVMLETAMMRCPPLGDAAIKTGWAGLYETTPDHHSIIDRAGHIENAYICAGFSGHGLMHAPAAGLLTAEAVLDGKPHTIDVSKLSFGRFANPDDLHHEVNVI